MATRFTCLQGEQEWSAAAREQEQRILSLQQDSEELKLTMRHMQVSPPEIRKPPCFGSRTLRYPTFILMRIWIFLYIQWNICIFFCKTTIFFAIKSFSNTLASFGCGSAFSCVIRILLSASTHRREKKNFPAVRSHLEEY